MSNPLLEQLRKLPLTERIQLVEDLWDSIASEADSLPIPESHRDELERRRALHRAHLNAALPWEEVRRQLLAEE
jgi:putative addiction module component (TIGR02574 family)